MKVTWLSLTCATIVATIASCAYHDSKKNTLDRISPSQVIGQFSSLNGKRVSVYGYLQYGNDQKDLWESHEIHERAVAFEKGYGHNSYCITLFTKPTGNYNLSSKNGKEVIVNGVITEVKLDNGEILMVGCNNIGIAVDSVVLKE